METSLQPSNRFVGMFDIIGFKALREQNGTSGLHKQFVRGILPAIQHSAAGKGKTEIVNGTRMYVPDFSGCAVRFHAISDSVIFFTADDSFTSFVSVIHSAFMLLQFGFSGGKAPYRGAIGWGDLIDDPRGILIGSAIEDAYAGESSQAWAGAMLTEMCREYADRKNYIQSYVAEHQRVSDDSTDPVRRRNATENARRLVPYPVPVQYNPKDGPATYGKLETYAIDWTIRMYHNASGKSFHPSSSGHAQTIAKNTQAFEKWARTNNR